MGQSTSKFSGELSIPFDVLDLILDLLDRDSLKRISTLNQNINREVNTRLWNSVVFSHGNHYSSRRKRRQYILRLCNAVIRDSRRARCIRDFRIRFYLPLASWRISLRPVLRKLCAALQSTPCLHTLSIELSIHEQDFARALSRHANKFTFSLKVLRSSLTVADGFRDFLASQPGIQYYYSHFDLRCPYPRFDPIVVIDDLPKTLLPSLREVHVARFRVRSVVQGRTLDSVYISTPCGERDIISSTSSLPPVEKAIVRHLQFPAIFPCSLDRHIPALINFWGISKTTLGSLRIYAARMPSQSEFPSILAHFPSLKTLEWTNCQGFEVSTVWYPSTMNDDWCTKFIQESSWNCPSLERLTFSNCFGASREWVAQHVSDVSDHGKGIWTQGGKIWDWENMHDNSYSPNRSPSLPFAFLLSD